MLFHSLHLDARVTVCVCARREHHSGAVVEEKKKLLSQVSSFGRGVCIVFSLLCVVVT